MKTTPKTIYYSFLRNPQNAILDFKGRYRGRRAFLIANGPSLNDLDLSLLKTEITFGVNNIYRLFDRMGFQPTFYFAEDSTVTRHHRDEINTRVTESIRIFPYVYHTRFDNAIFVNYSPYPPLFWARFSRDAARTICWGGVCTYAVMQIAYYMGFDQLCLVGFDHNWVDLHRQKRPAHFVDDYFRTDRKYNISRHLWIVNKSYRKARRVFEAEGREILNCTRGGKLEIFPRARYEDVVAHTHHWPRTA